MRKTTMRGKSGVTLTELLAVLAILGLLATLAVPVVINRANQAKFAIAKAEVEALAQGEDMCGLIHGYYVPLQMLDDVPYDTSSGYVAANSDDFHNDKSVPLFVIDTSINVGLQVGSQPNLNSLTPPRLARLESDWSGPFTQWQRPFKSASTNPSQAYARRDFPLDPWGNPYRLYSPLGITGDTGGTSLGSPLSFAAIDSDSFSNGKLTNIDDRFDRFAVVSFGPDGFSQGTNPGPTTPLDDIYYTFGTVVNETNFYVP